MPDFKWSSPVRRSGTRSLPGIPNEIYLEIFDHLKFAYDDQEDDPADYSNTLSNMALVCHFFCAIAISRHFETLTFSGTTLGSSGSSEVSGGAPFCRAINKDKDPAKSLAKLVKACTFDGWGIEGNSGMVPQWARTAFLGIYCQAIARMPHLESISIFDTAIDKRLLKAVCSCKKLSVLSLRGCTFGTDVQKHDVDQLASLSLVSFQFFDIHGPLLDHLDWPMDLRVFGAPSYRPSRKVQWQNLCALSFGRVSHLNHLFHLLEEAPHLTELNISITDSLTEPPSPLTIPTTTLPHLRVLSCPPTLARYLIPGRPVEDLDLSGEHLADTFGLWSLSDMDKDVLDSLSGSTGRIKKLKIPLQMFDRLRMNEHCPQLEHLSIITEHPNFSPIGQKAPYHEALIFNLIHRINVCPLVTTLILDLDFWMSAPIIRNLRVQYDAIQELRDGNFPNVTEMSITRFVRWKLDHKNTIPSSSPGSESGPTWRAFVPFRLRKSFTQEFAEDSSHCVDWKGCYARVVPQWMSL